MPDPYKTYEMASEGIGFACAAAGASAGVANPMGVVQNAQQAYHMHQYGKIVSPHSTNSFTIKANPDLSFTKQVQGMRQAIANEEKAREYQRQMQSPQVQASSLAYGSNGITRENGYVQDKDGRIVYVGKK
ncbi:uncharacterized protein N7477_005250 [Penicillium maclennaniae]|uniref:uncharacterized protein n=1 Tax=Penicillium maclennaniae TaxID=1343394 RepID=UPI002540DD3C|nr:uncharacterized protein N7477_005250 [Penicillium maclennaniae]KAJ5675316.1 hypothetical protein N7477_005250 [Penicillium maclennaniae]